MGNCLGIKNRVGKITTKYRRWIKQTDEKIKPMLELEELSTTVTATNNANNKPEHAYIIGVEDANGTSNVITSNSSPWYSSHVMRNLSDAANTNHVNQRLESSSFMRFLQGSITTVKELFPQGASAPLRRMSSGASAPLRRMSSGARKPLRRMSPTDNVESHSDMGENGNVRVYTPPQLPLPPQISSHQLQVETTAATIEPYTNIKAFDGSSLLPSLITKDNDSDGYSSGDNGDNGERDSEYDSEYDSDGNDSSVYYSTLEGMQPRNIIKILPTTPDADSSHTEGSRTPPLNKIMLNSPSLDHSSLLSDSVATTSTLWNTTSE
jgi:hypothetical protein